MKVRFINQENHDEEPEYYPAVGIVGEVIQIDRDYLVQWEIGSTSMSDKWYCGKDDVEEIEE